MAGAEETRAGARGGGSGSGLDLTGDQVRSARELREDAQRFGLTDAEQQSLWVAEGKRRDGVALSPGDEAILRRAAARDAAFPTAFGPRRGETGREVAAVPLPASFEEAEQRYIAAVRQERILAQEPQGAYGLTDVSPEAQRDRNYRREFAARVQATRVEAARALAGTRTLPDLARQEALARERSTAEAMAITAHAEPEARLAYLESLLGDAQRVATALQAVERELAAELLAAETAARALTASQDPARRAAGGTGRAGAGRNGPTARRRDGGGPRGDAAGEDGMGVGGPGEGAAVDDWAGDAQGPEGPSADDRAAEAAAAARVAAAAEALLRARQARGGAALRVERLAREHAVTQGEVRRMREARAAAEIEARARRAAGEGTIEAQTQASVAPGSATQRAAMENPAVPGAAPNAAPSAGPGTAPGETRAEARGRGDTTALGGGAGLEQIGGDLAVLEGALREARRAFAAATAGAGLEEAPTGRDGGLESRQAAIQQAAANVQRLEMARGQASAAWGQAAAARAMERAQVRVQVRPQALLAPDPASVRGETPGITAGDATRADSSRPMGAPAAPDEMPPTRVLGEDAMLPRGRRIGAPTAMTR